eukprot:4851284-Heterocapsa_arctica.AAC.1
MEQMKVGAIPGKQWRDRARIIGEMTKALEALCRGFAERAVEFAKVLASTEAERAAAAASGALVAARR